MESFEIESPLQKHQLYHIKMNVFYRLPFYFLLLAFFFLPLQGNAQESLLKGRILFLAQQGQISKALELYTQTYKEKDQHDFEILHGIGIAIVEYGFKKSDPESQLFSLFGATIAAHNETYHIVEESLKSRYPPIQLVALNAIAQIQNEKAEKAIFQALGSPEVLIRLQAAHHLCKSKHPLATSQTESLMYKVPKVLLPVFPSLFILSGDDKAIRQVRKMLNDPSEKVRIATILSIAKHKRDDLLPQIRQQAMHLNHAQQEATAYALGVLHDENSINKLTLLSKSQYPHVALAAHVSLYRLGQTDSLAYIEKKAGENNLFAIAALGEIGEGIAVLNKLLASKNLQVRINAALALLEQRTSDCFLTLREILIRNKHDLSLSEISSPGESLNAWKVTPSSSQILKDDLEAYVKSLAIKEEILEKARNFSEKEFLVLAEMILEAQENELVPITVELLEDLGSANAIKVLKKYQQKVGAPLVRNYCNLALYRMKEEGPYGDLLKQWVTSQNDQSLIQFRPFAPWQFENSYELTPQETSRLLIEAFQAFANNQDYQGVEALLDAIQNGNEKNRYALAGLLIHATQ